MIIDRKEPWNKWDEVDELWLTFVGSLLSKIDFAQLFETFVFAEFILVVQEFQHV